MTLTMGQLSALVYNVRSLNAKRAALGLRLYAPDESVRICEQFDIAAISPSMRHQPQHSDTADNHIAACPSTHPVTGDQPCKMGFPVALFEFAPIQTNSPSALAV
jgi:hypothetical protein